MIFLPIVGRELRVAARRKSTYRSRFWAAFFAIGVLAFLLLVAGRGMTAEKQAQDSFNFLAVLAFIYCIIAGIMSTSDCVSEEKRDGTLGLLFLTDLRGYDVVLGKLVASSVGTFYGLLSFFPVLAIPLLLGGVSREQVWYTVVVLLNTMFFSLSAGLWVSTFCKSDRKAMGGTIFVLFLFSAGLPIMGVLWEKYVRAFTTLPYFLYLLSSGFAFKEVMGFTFKTGRITMDFWWSTMITQCISWILLSLASLQLPRSWQERPAGVRALRWGERMKVWSFGNSEQRKAFRDRLLDVNAFFWLAGRNRLKPAHVWAFFGILGITWLWSYVKYPNDWLEDGTYIATEQVLHTVLKVWVAMEACRRLGEDHHSGALELILSTPITVAEILHGQMLALYRQFFGPTVLVLVIDFIFLLTKVHNPEWVWWHVGNTGMFLLDLYALAWVSMWTGLTARHFNRAPHATILRILVLPLLIWVGMFMLIALLDIHVNHEEQFILGSLLAVGYINSLFFWFTARSRLFERLRSIASHRFDPATAPAREATPAPRKTETPATA